ncbi:MAG: hypothetical protein O7B25_00375 [Gammaproteobacteria bacterium]|nr:hypothetical protein [Gammaproteobacteria bacterium]
MKTYLMASGLFLVMLSAGCATLPMDEACRANIEKETKVLAANGHRLQFHRSANFSALLSAAGDSEQIGDYQGCLNILQMAHVGRARHNRASGNYTPSQQHSYSGSYNGGYSSNNGGGGGSVDAAHHAAGHTHHHGH